MLSDALAVSDLAGASVDLDTEDFGEDFGEDFDFDCSLMTTWIFFKLKAVCYTIIHADTRPCSTTRCLCRMKNSFGVPRRRGFGATPPYSVRCIMW